MCLVRELTAILALVVVTLGCSGTIAILIAAMTVRRSRGRGWGHFFLRAVRLTLVISAIAVIIQLAVVVWDLIASR